MAIFLGKSRFNQGRDANVGATPTNRGVTVTRVTAVTFDCYTPTLRICNSRAGKNRVIYKKYLHFFPRRLLQMREVGV